KVLFLYCNLMDEKSLPAGIFHLIFIRNTLIYFSRENQRKILSCLLDRLKPEGYLFIGNAESLIGFDIPLNLVAPGVYKKVSYESKGN
ncbi:MAG: CheR family methyltransferase, partial [Mangrovibacterium sp.]